MKIFSRSLLELPVDAGDHGVKPGAFMVFRYTLLRWLPILVLATSGAILLISGAAWFYPGSEPGNRSEGWWYVSHNLGLSWSLALLAVILLVLFTLATAGHNRITRRKFNAELARLQRHNQQLAWASDMSGIVNWELDLAANALTFDDRSYQFLATSAVAQGGYQLPLEAGIEKFIHPGDRRRVRRGVDTLHQALAGATLYSLRFRLVSADGTTRQVLARVNVGGDNQGRARRVLCAGQDISAAYDAKLALKNTRGKLEDELQRRTLALTAKEQRCRELFEHNPMPMWIYDTRAGCFIDVNTTAIRLYGYSYSEFVGMKLADLFEFEEQGLGTTRSNYQNQGYGVEGNVRLLRRDGSAAVVILHSNDLPGLNSSTRMLMAHDIDEQVRAESELERAATILPDLLEGVCDALALTARDKGVTLNLFIDPTLPTQIWSDPTRLRQVLYNLIGNAVKFSGGRAGRPGRVEVCVERHANNRDFLAFSVRDNGVGISPKALPGLFNCFSQAEISSTRRFGGSGLGLAICKRLVELMGGKIMVQSTPEIGSDFSMVVPMQPVSEQSQVPGPDLRQLDCILVGGDTFHNRTLVTYLTHAGAAVHQVPNIAAIADCSGIKMSVPAVVIHYPEADQDAPAAHSGALPGHQYLPLEEMAQLNSGQVTGLPEVRNLLLKRGARQHARVESPDTVVYEDYFVRRQEWLHAVAVAAGRSSPRRERQAREEAPKAQPAAMSVAQARQNGMLILVAEDDAINQKVVLRQLSLLGYAAEVASNGVEALDLWQSGQYGLLLTDLHMPEMDGYELASRIRQQEHEHGQGSKHLPILMLSANALRGEAARARARGVDVYLTKPLQLNELREVLEQWLPNNQGRGSIPASNIAVARQDLQCVLDLEALTGIFGDDEQGKRKLLADFLGSSKLLVGEMAAAMQSRKYSHLSGLAHRLKASARAIGALPLGDACAELENVGRAEDFRAISECMRAFNDQFAQVEAAITRQAEGKVNA